MKVVLSIEGSKSNTEGNIFTELMAGAQAASKVDKTICQEFTFIPINTRKCEKTNDAIETFNGILEIQGFDIKDIESIWVIHDEDTKIEDKAAQECTFNKFAEVFPKINIRKVTYPREYGDKLNSIEGEFLSKIIPGEIIKKSEYKKHFGFTAKSAKEYSFRDMLTTCYGKKGVDINLYTPEGILKFIETLKNNSSSYYCIVKDLMIEEA